MKFDRITFDFGLMNGQPCLRHIRLSVRRVVELAALAPNRQDLQREYPELEEEDIRQALLYAAAVRKTAFEQAKGCMEPGMSGE